MHQHSVVDVVVYVIKDVLLLLVNKVLSSLWNTQTTTHITGRLLISC